MSWDAVTRQTIANCFRNAGFDCDTPITEWDEEDDIPLSNFQNSTTCEATFDVYADVDCDVQVNEYPSDEDILRSVTADINAKDQMVNEDNDESDDAVVNTIFPPTVEDTIKALGIV